MRCQARLMALHQVEKVSGMTTPRLPLRVALGKPFQSELPDRLQHREARLALAGPRQDQMLVEQLIQRRDNVGLLVTRSDPLRGLEGESSGEYSQTRKERLFRWEKGVVAPGDRVADRALPGGSITWSAGQQWQAVLQPVT